MSIGAAGAASALALSGCSRGTEAYEVAAAELRAALDAEPALADLVRYATLAANSHNTQPWRFALTQSQVAIAPDLTRRTPVVDPDDHHLWVSLGCAVENLLIAASARGRPGVAAFDASSEGRIVIDLGRGPADAGALFAAIPERQSTRSVYDGNPLTADELRQLEAVAAVDGVSLQLITDADAKAAVRDFVIAGNSAQIGDPAFVAELKLWIRFDVGHALKTRDGLYSGCSGNPSMPAWIGNAIFPWVLNADTVNDKYAAQIDSSAGIAVFTADAADPDHWVRVGRSLQRFALQATALGIRHAYVNQPVEVIDLRAEFASWLGAPEARPDLVIRFGRAPAMPWSLRRRADAVIGAPGP